jgi:hypothetical protein
MSEPISLKATERRVFQATHADGLWDVFIACFVAMFALGPLLSPSMGDFWSVAIFLPFWGLAYLAIWLIRRHVVSPRIGEVKFGPARRTRLRRFSVIMLALNCVSLLGGTIAAAKYDVVPGWVFTGIFGLILLNAFCLAGYFLDYPRLYVYGVVLFVCPIVGEGLYVYAHVRHHGYPVTYGIATLAILLTGLLTFLRLLRDNPPISVGTMS